MCAVVCLVNFNGSLANMTCLVDCVSLPQLDAVAIVLVLQLPAELRHGHVVDGVELVLQHATEPVALAIVARIPEVNVQEVVPMGPNVLGLVAMELNERDGLASTERNALVVEPGPERAHAIRCVAVDQLFCNPVNRI